MLLFSLFYSFSYFLKSNIFLFQNEQKKQISIKIGDLGNSKQMEKTYAGTFAGTLNYVSPELAANHAYTEKTDVW